MSSQTGFECAACKAHLRNSDPFCSECGELSPALAESGPLELELEEIPSEHIRAQVVNLLKSWFPDMDAVSAPEKLKADPIRLMTGVDEESGKRILEALKALKVNGRLTRPELRPSFLRKLLNPGLVISAAALIIALISGGLVSFLAVLAAAGVPVAWALVSYRPSTPLITLPVTPGLTQRWEETAREYAEVIREVSPEQAGELKGIARAVFEVMSRLSFDSVAATIAGGEKGDLYKRLRDTVRTAAELYRRSLKAEPEEKAAIMKEIEALNDTVARTGEWFRSVETDGLKEPARLQGEIADVIERIDALVREVKSPLEERLFQRDKTRL